MTKIWVHAGDGWKLNPGWIHISESTAHRIADHYNQKYMKQHYWVSEEKPGEEELEKIRSSKMESGIEFVDVCSTGGSLE